MKTTIILLAALFLASACETMQGLGRDLTKAGSNIEDAAVSLTP